MTPRRPAKRARSRKKKKPRGKLIGHKTLLVTRRVTRRARRISAEVLGVRCTVAGVFPEWECIVLTEHVSGASITIPLPSQAKDGRFAQDVAGLAKREVWLSLRVL